MIDSITEHWSHAYWLLIASTVAYVYTWARIDSMFDERHSEIAEQLLGPDPKSYYPYFRSYWHVIVWNWGLAFLEDPELTRLVRYHYLAASLAVGTIVWLAFFAS